MSAAILSESREGCTNATVFLITATGEQEAHEAAVLSDREFQCKLLVSDDGKPIAYSINWSRKEG